MGVRENLERDKRQPAAGDDALYDIVDDGSPGHAGEHPFEHAGKHPFEHAGEHPFECIS
jgi:hypothetical protein